MSLIEIQVIESINQLPVPTPTIPTSHFIMKLRVFTLVNYWIDGKWIVLYIRASTSENIPSGMRTYCPFDSLWKDVFRRALYSKWKCFLLIDHILSGTVCLFCFCALLSSIYSKIKFTARNGYDFYSKLDFWKKNCYAPAHSKNSRRALSVTPVRPVRTYVRAHAHTYVRPNSCPGHNS